MFKSLAKRLFSATPMLDITKSVGSQYGHKIRLFHGNILDHTDCDAWVSFITADLSLGGPLNKAFMAMGGEELADYIANNIIQPRPGDVFVVPGFGLPVPHLILAVLPEWKGGIDDEDRAMLRCYRRGLKKAQEFHIKKVAFPALGFGRLNFPHIRFARHAVRGILDGITPDMEEVRIIGRERGMIDIYQRQLKKVGA